MPLQSETLRHLLQKDENGSLDFKRKPHAVFNNDKIIAEQNQHELIRDVVALANGNSHVVGETAYLILGADDKRDAYGNRKLRDIGDFPLTRRQILDWINPKIMPRITELDCGPVEIDGKVLFVITIYPSEDVHITTTTLKTADGKQYSPQTTFFRINENNESASRDEEKTLIRAKRRQFEHSSYVHPIWAIGLSSGITAFILSYSFGGKIVPPEVIPLFGEVWAKILVIGIPTVLFTLTGLMYGKAVVDFKDIQRMWRQGTRKRRIWMVIIAVIFVGIVFAFIWLSV